MRQVIRLSDGEIIPWEFRRIKDRSYKFEQFDFTNGNWKPVTKGCVGPVFYCGWITSLNVEINKWHIINSLLEKEPRAVVFYYDNDSFAALKQT